MSDSAGQAPSSPTANLESALVEGARTSGLDDLGDTITSAVMRAMRARLKPIHCRLHAHEHFSRARRALTEAMGQLQAYAAQDLDADDARQLAHLIGHIERGDFTAAERDARAREAMHVTRLIDRLGATRSDARAAITCRNLRAAFAEALCDYQAAARHTAAARRHLTHRDTAMQLALTLREAQLLSAGHRIEHRTELASAAIDRAGAAARIAYNVGDAAAALGAHLLDARTKLEAGFRSAHLERLREAARLAEDLGQDELWSDAPGASANTDPSAGERPDPAIRVQLLLVAGAANGQIGALTDDAGALRFAIALYERASTVIEAQPDQDRPAERDLRALLDVGTRIALGAQARLSGDQGDLAVAEGAFEFRLGDMPSICRPLWPELCVAQARVLAERALRSKHKVHTRPACDTLDRCIAGWSPTLPELTVLLLQYDLARVLAKRALEDDDAKLAENALALETGARAGLRRLGHPIGVPKPPTPSQPSNGLAGC